MIDELRIRQILINLVSNAVKFTEKGSVTIIVKTNEKIDPKIKKGKIDLIIQVIDTGLGIPENVIDVIFESFRQVEGQSTQKFGGTGLGLAITKRLAELMDGTIKVESKINVGSTFTIKLRNIEIS